MPVNHDVSYPRIILEEIRGLRDANQKEHSTIITNQTNIAQRVTANETNIAHVEKTAEKHSKLIHKINTGANQMTGQWSAVWKIGAGIIGGAIMALLGMLLSGVLH